MTTFGELQIGTSIQSGEDSPPESEWVTFQWPWYWHLPRLTPWLILALAIAVPRHNRNRHALLIFVPLLILTLLWRPLAQSRGWSPGAMEEYGLVFESLVLGMALLWLSVPWFSHLSGTPRFVLSLGALLAGALATGTSAGGALARETAPLLTIATGMGAVLLLALAATRRRMGGQYQPPSFMLWLAFWSVLFSLLGTVCVAPLLLLFIKRLGIIGAFLPGLVLGLWLYAINLPYQLLLFSSPFFRQRFRVWLGAESGPSQGKAASPEGS